MDDYADVLCECCMKESDSVKLSRTYTSKNGSQLYAEMLKECFNIVIPSHPNGGFICTSCARQLRNASSFKRLVLRSQDAFALRRKTDCTTVDMAIQHLELVKKEELSSDDEPLSALHLDMPRDMSTSPPTPNASDVKKEEYEEDLAPPPASFVAVEGRKKRSKETRSKHLKKKQRGACKGLAEAEAHATNTGVLLASCNATPFKGKNMRGFRCFYCDRCFKQPEHLRRHTDDEHRGDRLANVVPKFDAAECVVYLDITSLCCKICDQSMSDLDDFRAHLINIHNKTLLPIFGDRCIPFKLSEQTLDCQKCCQRFETFGALERHMNTHFRNFVCDICGSGYVTVKRLKTHASFAHSSGSFPCASCEKIFTSAIKAKKHFDSVHNLKNRYKCPHCDEKFYKYFQRQAHLVKQHNATPLEYKCSLCSRIFEMKDSLNKHTRKHHLLERNYACVECSYTCFTSTGLRNHMVSHTGERTYRCAVCNKAYARKNTLTQHMKIHNNDRRYTCNVCGHAFVQNCSLKSHIRTHHGDMKGSVT